jgi:hypothetical protein
MANKAATQAAENRRVMRLPKVGFDASIAGERMEATPAIRSNQKTGS